MQDKRIIITGDDVVTLEEDSDATWIPHRTFRAEEFLDKLSTKVEGKREKELKWINDGVACQVLDATNNKGWMKGRLRLCVEFIPDTLESPLDEIRQGLL